MKLHVNNFFRDRYLTVDTRSLALFRLYVGILAIVDLVRRIPDITVWYTNEGILPNHVLLWRPQSDFQFSFFFSLSTLSEALLGFLICFLCYFSFLIGWRTKLFNFLSLICCASLHTRVTLVENGGDAVLCLLLFWGLFFPLGIRFSVDALQKSYAKVWKQPTETGLASSLRRPQTVTTVAMFGFLLQIAIIYFFNYVQKVGIEWKEGTAVHYVLHQDRVVTILGATIRDHLPLWFSQASSWGALFAEAVLPILVLSPILTFPLRRVAAICIFGLHLGIALMINIGVFSYAIWGLIPLLLRDYDWRCLQRLFRRREVNTVVYDETSTEVIRLVWLIAKFDLFGRLSFVPRREMSKDLSPILTPETIKQLISRVDSPSLLTSIPSAWLPSLLLRLRAVKSWLSAEHSKHQHYGILSAEVQTSTRRPWLRESLCLFFIVAMFWEAARANRWVPNEWKPPYSKLIGATYSYTRIGQGWGMFMYPPIYDDNIVVEAKTIDGRVVDPLNELASNWQGPPMQKIPRYLGQDSLWTGYMMRIDDHGNEVYLNVFRDWILRYHERTGRSTDKIIAFNAYLLVDKSPAPGETESKDTDFRKFFSHP